MAHLAPNPRLARLAAALCFVFLAVAPAATAGGADSAPLAIPAPMQGDAWTYAVARFDAAEGGLTPHDEGHGKHLAQRAFVQGGPSTARTAEGTSLATARLVDRQVWFEAGDQTEEERAYDVAADGAVIAERWLRDGPGANADFNASGLPNDGRILESAAVFPVIATTWTHAAPPFCGYRNSLQGHAIASGSSVELAGCGDAARFIPIGTRPWHGADAFVYGWDADPESLQVWFAPGVTVPVRLLDARSDVATFYDMLQFTPGAKPVAYGTPDAKGLPAVAFAKAEAFGPSEAGVVHPFPLSAAYAAAKAATTSEFGAFLQSHPNAYLQSATFEDLRTNKYTHTQHDQRWVLVASDGKDAAAARVTQSTLEAKDLPTTLETPAGAPTVEDRPTGKGPWPVATSVPRAFPTVASLMQRWAATTTAAGPANAWGFTISCGATCNETALSAWAGADHSFDPNEVYVGFASAGMVRRDADLMAVDAQGRTVWTEQVRVESEHYLAITPVAALGTQDEPDPVPAHVVSGDIQVPWTGVATVGIILALAAVALWLLKAGPLTGLFSREIPDVTAHPVRRAILDAVEGQPGIHHSELLRRVGKGNSVVTNHVRRLEAAGLITQRQGPRFLCYFPKGTGRAALDAAPLVKSPVAQGILAAVAQAPASGQDLAARLGVEPGAITYHAQRLSEAGLIATRREGRFVMLEATPSGREAAGPRA